MRCVTSIREVIFNVVIYSRSTRTISRRLAYIPEAAAARERSHSRDTRSHRLLYAPHYTKTMWFLFKYIPIAAKVDIAKYLMCGHAGQVILKFSIYCQVCLQQSQQLNSRGQLLLLHYIMYYIYNVSLLKLEAHSSSSSSSNHLRASVSNVGLVSTSGGRHDNGPLGIRGSDGGGGGQAKSISFADGWCWACGGGALAQLNWHNARLCGVRRKLLHRYFDDIYIICLLLVLLVV